MTCRDCAYWKQGELVDRGGTAVFKERKNKAPYLEHYCRGMTDRQIAEITGRSSSAVLQWRKRNKLPPNHTKRKNWAKMKARRLQIARAPEKERRIIREFMSDLIRCARHCPEPDVRNFIKTWRNEKGVKQVWDSPAPQKSREKKKQSA